MFEMGLKIQQTCDRIKNRTNVLIAAANMLANMGMCLVAKPDRKRERASGVFI